MNQFLLFSLSTSNQIWYSVVRIIITIKTCPEYMGPPLSIFPSHGETTSDVTVRFPNLIFNIVVPHISNFQAKIRVYPTMNDSPLFVLHIRINTPQTYPWLEQLLQLWFFLVTPSLILILSFSHSSGQWLPIRYTSWGRQKRRPHEIWMTDHKLLMTVQS